MATVYEDFLRCPHCQNADFEERTIVTLPIFAKKRDEYSKDTPITPMEKQVKYVCTTCRRELDM